MIDHFTTESVIHFLTAMAAYATIVMLWQFRKSMEVRYMIFVQIFVSIWAISYALEFSTSTLASKIFWSKISYLGISFLPLCFYLFTTAFSQKKDLIKTQNIVLLMIIPIITLGMVFTNDSHKLVWTEVTLDSFRNIAITSTGSGSGFFSDILKFCLLPDYIICINRFSDLQPITGRKLQPSLLPPFSR